MVVVHTKESSEQLAKDLPRLQALHAQAMLEDMMWDLFGGELCVEGRRYQVVERYVRPSSSDEKEGG